VDSPKMAAGIIIKQACQNLLKPVNSINAAF
jgi:hypothetical protein